jgi:hypothetical protein
MNEIVEIKEFRVEKLNPSQKVMEVSIAYIAKENGKIIRKFDFNDTPLKFTEALLEEVRKASKCFEIEKHNEMRDKIGNIMIRLAQEIKDLSKIKEHEEFMKAFNKINCFKTSFPEIEV